MASGNMYRIFCEQLYIYRPVELEALSCYDFVAYYELKKMDKKKIESGNHVIESKKVLTSWKNIYPTNT